MAIGGSAQVALTSRNTQSRKRLHKQLAARRMLLEALEGRQLMAVGPQLLGVQPNEGTLLVDGQVRHISPNELVFRFDDRVGLDPNTLDGIRLIRSGADGEFERASMATDLGSGGQVLVEFYAAEPGQVGNGIQISFTQVNRADSRAPVVRVSGRNVSVEVNSNPLLETRVDDLIRAFDQTISSNTVTNLVYGLRLRGSTTLGIGRTVDTTKPVVLSGANAAKITTDFGTGANLQVRLNARESGAAGIGVQVNVTTRDRGGPGAPIVTVAGKIISVELNSNIRNTSTVNDFVAALNGNAAASALVEATLISGIGSTRLGSINPTYSPLVLSGVSDVEIIPAYVGLGDTSREVIMRFASALPDDRYRIEILGRGTRALLNLNGDAYNDGVDKAISFELDLGAQIESIVPQPVERNATTGALSQATNRIDVYFNNDDLINSGSIRTVNGLTIDQLRVQRPTLFFQSSDIIINQAGTQITPDVLRPQYYQLFHLNNTLTNTDDTRILPTAIRYFPEADRAQLTFARPLGELVNPGNNQPLARGELRLRIGTNDATPLPPISYSPVGDAADTFAGADNLSMWTPGSGSQSIVVNSEINNTTPYVLDFPGGSDEIGSRYNRMQDHLRRMEFTGALMSADAVDGTSTIFYNFQTQLGRFTGTTLLNSITEQQKQRAREVFSLYERYLGVRFVETENLGLTIAVGDTRAVFPFPETSLSTSPGVITLNSPGNEFLESGILATGQLATVLDSQDFGNSTDNDFGGSFSRAVAQGIGNLLGLGGTDDLEGFTTQAFSSILAPGVGTEIVLPGDAEIVHGQYLYRPDSKDIDLYQFRLPSAGRISIEAFAERMSQASLLDTQIRLYQQQANGSWIEVAANDDYYSSDSFVELELGAGNYIVGVSASGNNQYDPTIADSGLNGRSQGRYQLRMDFRAPAAAVLNDATGTALDGDADGKSGGVFDFWFRPSTAANTKFVDKAAAAGGNGSITSPFRFIRDALAAAQPGDVVRVVGNGGTDGRINTAADNLPYEIGFNAVGQVLPDGSSLDVPKDVALFIDAGAVLKLRRARLGVGSTSASVDRSGGSLMVLGTPVLVDASGAVIKDSAGVPAAGSVFFTSIADTTLGRNASPAVNGTTPLAGDWGGLDFRNRIDAQDETRKNYEKLGQFLNWVSHADLRYGGGQVVVDGVSQVITPVQMVDARPSVVYSMITRSADAAMSATPNSFLETNFHTPDEQRAVAFTADYSRIGPEIHGNTIVDNSLNGLLVRVRTGATVESMTVAGRFDDTDIVHIIPENLTIAGTAGGFISDTNAPPTTIVTLTSTAGGTLTAGTYRYRLTYVDSSGNESPASNPTQPITVVAGSQITLANLPPVRSGSSFVARRLYRSDATGTGNYVLVRELNASSTTIIDTGSTLGAPLNEATVTLRSRLDGRLAIDGGTVVKLQGARIEVQFGSQLIAEGSSDRPVIFTSTSDVRYGAGGTFATSTNSLAAAAGNWGGIYIGPTSSASIDHAVISYAGGTTRVEGGFADFSAVEAHQADLRLTNSRLELNADASLTPTDPDRGGRGINDDTTIFVLGAQPVIADNIIVNNGGSAISINVSALNSNIVTDWGRATGPLSLASTKLGNQGALVEGNRMNRNAINGMVVRGGILTTEGVWDDTDIVHVVLNEIRVPNFNTYGGLRLQSSNNQSLVVKLRGNEAGFTAAGQLLDNADRIGGSVQLVGLPGSPVILTSLADDTVGVGFTPEGVALLDTDNRPAGAQLLPTGPEVNNGLLIDNDVPQNIPGFFGFDVGAGGSANFGGRGGITAQGRNNLLQNLDVIFDFTNYIDLGSNGGGFDLANTTITRPPTLVSDDLVVSEGTFTGPNGLVNWRVETFLNDGEAKVFNKLFLNSAAPLGDIRFINYLDEDVAGISDDILWTTGTPGLADFRAYTLDGPERIGFSQGGIYSPTAGELVNATYTGWAADQFAQLQSAITGAGTTYTVNGNIDLVDLPPSTDASLGTIYGPEDITTAFAWNVSPTANSAVITSFLELIPQDPSRLSGDWRSVLLAQNSNDRNVASLVEAESEQAKTPGTNGSTSSAEFLGQLAPDLNNGDENRRLGFQVQGVISEPGDVDVYSFVGRAGSEVWFDIDRTQNSLDTVVELVDASGRILALSDNTLNEEANPALLFRASDMPSQSVHSLRKSTPELYLRSATGAPKDLYSTNPRDAGMRVVLPGEPGTTTQYHIRVRSSNLRPGDAASRLLDPALVNAGLTKGAYQLQVRLREIDEIPGSSLTYADLRFASTGLDIRVTPHSPLLGETAETTAPNGTIGNAQPLGNLLVTDKQAISIAGSLDAFADVDWYSFTIDYTAIRPTGLREYFATVFDVDYADGIGRPDLSLYVFDSTGRLIMSGLGSNLVDDQAAGLAGAGSSDLSRGSAGSLDPYIGSVELPVGQYFLAVTNSDNVPRVLESYTNATVSGATAAIRLQPTNGVQLIAEDHIGSTGGSTGMAPATPVLFPTGGTNVQFNLGDVSMYVSQNVALNGTNVYMVNPFTGGVSNTVGRFGQTVNDIAFRFNGELRAFDISPQFPNGNTDQDTLMDYLDIDPGTAAAVDTGDLGIQTSHVDGTNAADSNDGMYPNAITFASIGGQERGFIVGSRGFLFPRNNVGLARPGVSYLENVIYEFDENSGAATSSPAGDKTGIAIGFDAGTAIRERGYIETGTLGAPVTGLIAREATRVTNTGATVRVIRDGDTFTLLDSSNFTATFEFDSGPEVLVNYNPAAGLIITDGLQFRLDGVVYEFNTIQGTPGVTPGAIAINISETSTYRQVVDAIARSVGNGITVSSEGNRLTFSGALIGEFTQLQNVGVFIDQGSSGNVSPGAIKVPFLATDTADDIAARMAIAINASGIPGLSASASDAQVNLFGGTVVNAGPLNNAGAPGGTVTGIAVVNGVMFAVSDAGGLYRVNSPTSLAVGNVGTYITSSYDLLGIEFAGLTAGPQRLQNGAFAQTLFGIDTNGVLYAFDTSGNLLPIFAGGATSVDTGLFGANGISFSTLDYNLWHVSTQRGAEPGHGLPVTPDASRGTRVEGGSSLYFGFESPGANGVNYSSVTDPVIRNSYDFPGGAAGAIESQPFDLSGLSDGDLPTLYFNYRFDSENANAALPLGQSQQDYMRDSLRVYVSGEDGQWILAATNNSTRGSGDFDDEFDPLLTGNADVQELFDNNGQWRQARVPLDAFAGQANVRLRIEFSSAGGFGFGMEGGKGPELRMISGDRLQDGQIVTIGGQDFELEMGPSLMMPAGSSLTAGNSVTIEGVTYVFNDGSIVVPAPNISVPFTATSSAEQVAAALRTAILAAPRVQATVNVTAGELNDTISNAIIGSLTGNSAVITVTGSIGDNIALADPTADVDVVRVDMARGSTVVADVQALVIGSTLDTYLRVFDSSGTELAANDNRFGSTDSRITFTAPANGSYYFAVSGSGNSNYKANVFNTGVGASSGSYQLVLNLLRQLNPVVSGGRVQLEGVANITVPANSPVLVQGSVGSNTGIPVYVNVGMSAAQVGQALQAALANAYSGGNVTAFPLRGDTLDLTGLVQYDSFDFLTGLPAPSAAQLSPGPFGASTNFVGDAFGAFNASTDFAGNRNNANPGALRAQANAFEGVYLDDFIIGLAGRGEMIMNAPANDTTFIRDPQLSLTLPVQSNPEVLVGPYQLEIRGGTEYGQPLLDGFPTTLDLVDALPIQERLASGVAVRFNGASAFAAGTTFTISDGTRTLTFELDNVDDNVGTQPGNVPVPFSNAAVNPITGAIRSETAGEIAARIRDLVNSAAVQSVLDVNAVLLNSDATGTTNNTVVLIGQVSVNVPTSVGTTIISRGRGDSNRVREQGQIVVQSTKISNSSQFGINISTAGRDANGNPIGGTPRNLLTLNPERLVPGAVVMNSQLVGNGAGGISVSGDPTIGGVPASVPYARLVNNTIVGSSRAASGTGIRVQNSASPTLLNNVVANLAIGLSIDASSTSTVVGGMVFHRNSTNTAGSASVGQFATIVPSSTEIFTNLVRGNLYPAANSPLIDSSIDSLQDRTSLATVKNSVGIGPSSILAPQYDINGLLRVDDPTVSSPAGLGDNVFKDRGALDRADSVGPSVVMLEPVDNDVTGLDSNPAESVIELTNYTARYFDIQLFDGLEPSDPNRGSNIDDSTVTSASVLVYQDNIPLVDGIDYRFGYDPTTNVIRLTPLAGVFSSSSVYQIRFVNTREFAIGTLRGRDYVDGARIQVTDNNDVVTTFEVDTGFLVTVPSADGVVADVADGGVLTVDDGVRRLTFEFDNNGVLSSTNNIAITLPVGASATVVAQRLQAALQAAAMQLTVVDLGTGRLQIDGSSIASINVGSTGLSVTGQPGVSTEFGIQIPLIAGRPVTLADGETFTINRTTVPVTFEIDTNGVVTPGRTPVRINAGASAATIGTALVNAIRNAGLGLLPTYVGNGLVTLGGDANTVLGLTNTQLRQAGIAGQPASVPVKISGANSVDESAVAVIMANAINSRNLTGITATAFGDRVVVAGAKSVTGSLAVQIQSITDNAGNALKPNQTNGQTTLTVFLGEGLDYGDAPDPTYLTKRDSNGPRHTVVNGFSLGAEVRPDADAKLIDADEFDDGVSFSTLVAAFQSSATVSVKVPTGTSAYLSGWIDYNRDGVFSNTERIANALPVNNGTTTLSFIVTGASLTGTTYARFRLSSDPTAIATATGLAPDGEVEDYAVTIVGNPYKNQANGMDVNGDGRVTPIDALQVINYLNSSAPKTLTLPRTPAAPFVDVNGDGFVTALDALMVINFLNTLPPGGSGEGEDQDPSWNSAAFAAGTGVADVGSGDWMQELALMAVPMVETKADQQDEEDVPADAYFATMVDDQDEVVVGDSTVQRGNNVDDVLMTMTSAASEIADEVVTSQAGWMIRQRLASAFRR